MTVYLQHCEPNIYENVMKEVKQNKINQVQDETIIIII